MVTRAASSGLQSFPSKNLAGLHFLRRCPGSLFGLGFCLLLLTASSPAASFEYEEAVERAGLIAQDPYQEPEKLPEFLTKISYDQWQKIRFIPEDALWHEDKLPFQVQFFHPGSIYRRSVDMNLVDESGQEETIPFSREYFHYGLNDFQEKVPENLGFAGLRICFPFEEDGYQEVVRFLGASYFRAVGSQHKAGVSARGLAIDTGLGSGEEFPYFKEFWLVRPQEEAKSITLFALMDSPSLSGAYRFSIQPGSKTLIQVTATLFLRKEVKKLGIAPMNGMFYYGENINIRPRDDYRPEVHNVDSLQIATAPGEWIWRPLVNPPRLLVTSFQLKNPKGFGIMQRDLDFDHYLDLEEDYQKRPSAWIVPEGDWGEGRVELVQIPTDNENNENIVSYWVPAGLPETGNPVSFSYQMIWGSPETTSPPLARAVATRTLIGEQKEVKKYTIEFEGEKLRPLSGDQDVKPDISVGGGDVSEEHVTKNDVSGGWRMVFKVTQTEGVLEKITAANSQPLELRGFLRKGDTVLTETWNYVDPY